MTTADDFERISEATTTLADYLPAPRGWDAVDAAVPNALAIAWDGCHKVYLLMDSKQVTTFGGYDYGADGDGSYLRVRGPDFGDTEIRATLREWFDHSCGLRFVSAVRTEPNPNDGFDDLIPQFSDDDEEDE